MSTKMTAMFKFSLRDLFWLVLVAALSVGLWLYHRQHAHDVLLLRHLAEMTQMLMESLKEAEQRAAVNEPSREYSGTLVEVVEEPANTP